MLKTKFKILLSILLVLLLITSYCLATEEPSKKSDTTDVPVTTTGEETSVTPEVSQIVSNEQTKEQNWINNDLFQIDDTVNMNTIVDGNAFIIGNNVIISGEIGGDLFVIADKLTINGGYVYSSIFAIANEITINGKIYDLYGKCNTFNLGANGSIFRDIKISASNVNISGKVRRNAYISADTLNIAEGAEQLIAGNLSYSSSKEATIPQGAVAGEVNFSKSTPTENAKKSVASYVVDLAKAVLFTFVVALLLLWLAPKFVEKIANVSGSRVLAALGVGLISPICIGIVCLILLVSIVAIPLSVCVAFIFLSLALAGKAITSIYFGKLITKKMKAEGNGKLILCTLLVTAVLWLITLIPVFGGIASAIATLLGIGLVVINLFRKKQVSE